MNLLKVLPGANFPQIESLPTRADNEAPLQNVLSISTAGKNRYLLHFNSHHSLIQWTAGIRLAMFEHATLQEAYTGALIAGKGKTLNNIGVILERARFPTADWARVRFGAGTPWRRCWCVITPPDEKEVQKLQKQLLKKKSAYDRASPPVLKGDIKFYDTKKTKKVRPIATITDAYSAFAIYPQSKPLIDASTLVKLEGSITIHSNPPTTTEGFVFVMPEAHAAVTGFEILLRWLFPAFDTFALYGRPTRLIAETTDSRSLMFAMPKHRRYGYLEILDVSNLILEQGSSTWRESEWRKRMKEMTGKRMAAIENGSRRDSRYGSRRSARNSFGPSRSRVQFDDGASVRSSPSVTWSQPPQVDGQSSGIPRTDSAPPGSSAFAASRNQPHLMHQHHRSVSETDGLDRMNDQNPVLYDGKFEQGPPPPPHVRGISPTKDHRYHNELAYTPERVDSEDEQVARSTPVRELQELQAPSTPEPVAAPPAFLHAPGTLPISKPHGSPELRRANSRMSSATLSQLAGASGVVATYQTSEDQRHQNVGQPSEDRDQRGVMSSDAKTKELPLTTAPREGLATGSNRRFSFEKSSPSQPIDFDSHTQHSQPLPALPFNSSNLDTSQAGTPGSNSNIFYDASSHSHPQQQPFLGHSSHPSNDSTFSTSSQPPRAPNRQSILRKPLPGPDTSLERPGPVSRTSGALNQGHPVMDQEAYNMIRQSTHQRSTQHRDTERSNTGITSIYDDDNSSTVSPDYASTRRSLDTRPSVEKPRAGVMRTVGNGDNNESNQRPTSLVPNFDFGPTLNYAASPKALPTQNQGRQSPGPGLNTFPVDHSARQHSPMTQVDSRGHSRPSSRNAITPENIHIRNESGSSRTLAWQPGMGGGNISPGGQVITAEQFVQQRASVARPMYSHQRQGSSGNIMRGATPPLRNRDSDFYTNHSRNNSTDMLQRPGSRGANVALAPAGSGDIATKLSAREQEHVARVTGQPLIKMAHNRKDSQGAGLVGAIQQREVEKQQMKQGINSQAVQNAISQRQQQQQGSSYRKPSPGALPSQMQYAVNQYPPRNQPPQQTWSSPQANAYWSASPTSAVPNTRQSPSQGPPRQQYPFPPQQGQQGYYQNAQGSRSNPGFHGHGN